MANTNSTNERSSGEVEDDPTGPITPPHNYILQTLGLVSVFYVGMLALQGIFTIYLGVTTSDVPENPMTTLVWSSNPTMLSAIFMLIVIGLVLTPIIFKVLHDADQIRRSPIGEFEVYERTYTIFFTVTSIVLFLIGERIVFQSHQRAGSFMMIAGVSLMIVVSWDLLSRDFAISIRGGKTDGE